MISHAIDGDVLVIKAEGTYTTDDVRETFAAALSDLKLPPNARLLIDGRETRANPSASEIETRLGLLKGLMSMTAPFCAVVVSDQLHFGIARMYQAGAELRGGPRIEIFKSIGEAKQWLMAQVAVYLLSILTDVSPWLSASASSV